MSNGGLPKGGSPKGPKRAPEPGGSGIFRDPVVRAMTFVALGLVILFLVTVVSALTTGVLDPPSGPRTVAERQLALASEGVARKGALAPAWAEYVNALVATGDLGSARVALASARASVAGTTPAYELDVAEARLLSAERRYEDAVDTAGKAMKGYQARYDVLVSTDTTKAVAARRAGLGTGYYEAALVRAYAYVKLSQYSDAVKMFDLYIRHTPTASDILIDRGNAKADMKDNAGAEKDFREALKYVPYDADAKAGLKRIGVSQ